ncbi:glycosyltransferase family 2 protein [bacterium]|nr:glycosyltransferase family 2 protein [bacterium]
MKNKGKFSIIIPSHNGMGVLPRCMATLKAQTYKNFEVIVALNLTTDDSEKYLRSLNGLDIKIVKEDTIASSYAARNLALASASGDLIAFIDDDCYPEEDWLEKTLPYLESNDLIAGHISILKQDPPNFFENFDEKVHVNQEFYASRGRSAGGNLIVKKEVIERIGPFPVHLISGGDGFWSSKCTESGFSIVYAPDSMVWHKSKKSFRELWIKRLRIGVGHYQTGENSFMRVIRKKFFERSPEKRSSSGNLKKRLTACEKILFFILSFAYLKGLLFGKYFQKKFKKKRL